MSVLSNSNFAINQQPTALFSVSQEAENRASFLNDVRASIHFFRAHWLQLADDPTTCYPRECMKALQAAENVFQAREEKELLKLAFLIAHTVQEMNQGFQELRANNYARIGALFNSILALKAALKIEEPSLVTAPLVTTLRRANDSELFPKIVVAIDLIRQMQGLEEFEAEADSLATYPWESAFTDLLIPNEAATIDVTLIDAIRSDLFESLPSESPQKVYARGLIASTLYRMFFNETVNHTSFQSQLIRMEMEPSLALDPLLHMEGAILVILLRMMAWPQNRSLSIEAALMAFERLKQKIIDNSRPSAPEDTEELSPQSRLSRSQSAECAHTPAGRTPDPVPLPQ